MFERHLRAIDRKMQQLIAADEARARKLEILTSIPGIAATTAAGLLAEMPELGALTGKAAASLAGLAAVPREFPASPELGRAGRSSGADGRGRDGSCTCRRWPPRAGTPTWPRCTGG